MAIRDIEITENILDYILGGKACFAIKQDSKPGVSEGGIIWYEVVSPTHQLYFVNRMQGAKRLYLGYFHISDLGRITSLRTSKKEAQDDPNNGKPLVVVLNSLKKNGKLPGNGIVHIISDGRCSVCGRRLTDLNSISNSVGPECAKKLKAFFEVGEN